jgi:GntR family transcriptional regulator of arabinose operon
MRKKTSKVREMVLESLNRGDFQVGDKLPPEAELIRSYGVSRTTIREGLASLVQEGILTRRQGSGTYVTGLSSASAQRTRLAVMVPCVNDYWKSRAEVIRAIEDESNANGYSLILCNHDGLPRKARDYTERLIRDGVAGVIYYPVFHGEALATNLEIVRRFEQAGIPMVLIGSSISAHTQSRYTFVGSNGFSATQQLTQHLIHLGHRHLAYIRGLPGVQSSDERFSGFLDAVAAAGLTVPADCIKQIKPTDVACQGTEEIRELLQASPVPTAVVCVHDLLARNVILELQRLGKRVPDDIAVVGFDDLPFAETFDPALTTVRPPMSKEGQYAVQVLRGKIEVPSREVEQIFLECELIVRESCGAPPGMRTRKRTMESMQLVTPN